MNLLVKKLKAWAVVLLMSLFFVSCEDPGKIGLNIDPEHSVIATSYKEFVLPSSQVQFNPRSTTNSSSFQSGIYTDSDFGTVMSNSYLWLGVQPSTPALDPESATYVSTTLSIQFSSFYGSKAEELEIESYEVYQLSENLDEAIDYTRLDNINYSNKLGDIDILIQKDTKIRNDSLFTFAIEDSFGEVLFNKLKDNDAIYDNDPAFNEFIKGIAIIGKASNNKIVQFNPVSFNIKINYTEENSAGEIVERSYLFDIGEKRFYHLSSDLSGTSLAGILPNNANFQPTGDFRFMQTGTMIALKLDLNPVYDYFNNELNSGTVTKIIIQKAALSLGKVSINTPGASYPFSLLSYFTNSENLWPAPAVSSGSIESEFVLLQTETILGNTAVFPGFYRAPQDIVLGSTDPLRYNATMSNFFQNIISDGYNTSETPLEQGGEMLIFATTSASDPQSSPSHTQTNFLKVHKDSIRVTVFYATTNL